ncbi:aspartate aminotransferase family protein [Leptolyngbyaceae cyanobacterium CCMR0082]|uniref:Acetylornithine aminotransferase n=2 Tax=Adonisia turfae TaxID=2950184 RepID=A0A6M0S6I1_9CYAN|nr:aspartate aminotransferase family protein [Leptothoe sp. LEGE 181152]NEZ60732.1 aspartate aminotransferase family protein [Adonisia turfae CCMR0081]NEZ63996.1 aspartate aminotransferase family protein [Adonisia turfae CCMR0082]
MVSLKQLVKNPLKVFGAGTKAGKGFRPEVFDSHVMTTYGRFPLALTRGAGCRVWDDQGHEYLDFVAGIATCTLGHAHPIMVEAVTQQIQKLHHVSNLYYIPEQGALAQWLTEHSCADRVFFCNSGAEANEGAIKLARKYGHTELGIDEPVVITAKASFHGRTLATITATGQPKYQKSFSPLVPGFHYVPFNDGDALEGAIASLNASGPRVAAILLEALQGEGGVNPGNVEYFQRVRQLCDQHKILLILDEVQVGVGRTGKVWGYENLGIEPDVITVAKGLGGGVPIGAMMCKSSCDVLGPGEHASTYGGNPFVCGVALAVCQTLESENLMANASARGQQLRQGLLKLVDAYPELFEQARGWGLINGLVLNGDAPLTSLDIVKAAMNEGLLLVPAGPNVVRFVPPLIVSAADVDEALKKLSKAVKILS